jgi:hypothetical protein
MHYCCLGLDTEAAAAVSRRYDSAAAAFGARGAPPQQRPAPSERRAAPDQDAYPEQRRWPEEGRGRPPVQDRRSDYPGAACWLLLEWLHYNCDYKT